MLPICFPIVEDELFQGWVYALSDALNMKLSDFSKMYFDQQYSIKYTKHTTNLDEIVGRYFNVNHFFPGIYEIIGKHTDYPVAKICMNSGMAAYTAECILRKNDYVTTGSRMRNFRICPICEKEDQKTFSRRIVRVQHQIDGVKVCWKHSCGLSGENIDDLETEIVIARFAADLFDNPPNWHFEDVAELITNDSIFDAVSSGYLSKEDGKRLSNYTRRAKNANAYMLIRFLAWKYSGEVKRLLQDIPDKNTSPNCDLYKRIYEKYDISELRCYKCGMVFHMTNNAINAGEVCPLCRSGMTEEERMTRILSRYSDGKYELRNNELFHTVCGRSLKIKRMFWLNNISQCQTCKTNMTQELWKDRWKMLFEGTGFSVAGWTDTNTNYVRNIRLKHSCGFEFDKKCNYGEFQRHKAYVLCPVCDKESKHKKHQYNIATALGRLHNAAFKHTGERRIGKNGIGCEIVDYVDYTHVVVRFDNGLEKHMKMENFKQIGTGKRDIYPELYIGLKQIMNDGRLASIIEYVNYNKILVSFPDGSTKWSNLTRFRQGTIGCDARNKKRNK